MKSLLIFGTSELSDIAWYYFTHDSQYSVKAFVLDRDYIKETTHLGLPVIPFDEISISYPPEDHDLFIAMSYSAMNRHRARKYQEAKSLGYHLPSYVSSKATVWPDLSIGNNCFILEDNTIQPFVKIGSNVTLWSGNHIGHHASIADHNFISSHVVISGGVHIEEYCFIGVNATLRDHITIRKGTVIGAGALILKDTQENEVYKGVSAELAKVTSDKLRSL